jgi:DNA modification methylase
LVLMFDAAVPAQTASAVSLLCGDAETRLRELPDGVFHACVTSPPYYGLRSYGGAEIGHESTPDAFAARLVAVFREVRRTLRDDGSLYLVLGDSYARDPGKGIKFEAKSSKTYMKSYEGRAGIKGHLDLRGSSDGFVSRAERPGLPRNLHDLKEKDLIGVPWLVAFALRADGWYLREAIVWRKSSCMPESVTDRCTIQHEYVFHLTKSPTYYHDSYAIAEPAESNHPSGNGFKRDARLSFAGRGSADPWVGVGETRNARSVWDINPEPFEAQMCLACRTYYPSAEYRRLPKDEEKRRYCFCGANDRWLSHFAVFPTRLVNRCLRASTPDDGCCGDCGAPTKRVVEAENASPERLAACGADASGGYGGSSRDGGNAAGAQDASATKARILAGMKQRRTIGWEPSCTCGTAGRRAALVLDPFSGAGTTAMCAARLGRDAVGIDLNPDYVAMTTHRLRDPAAKCLDTTGERLPFLTCEAVVG